MNSNSKLAALASTAMLLGTSVAHAATYDYANVISSQPIINYVTVRTPVRECWEETQYYTVDRRAGHKAGGTILGAIIGGVVGHQIGSGRGNDAATVAGSLIGAAIGNGSSRNSHRGNAVEQQARQIERCKTTYRERREERIDGYRVTYRYNGQKYETEMPYDPGQAIRVRVDIRPAR